MFSGWLCHTHCVTSLKVPLLCQGVIKSQFVERSVDVLCRNVSMTSAVPIPDLLFVLFVVLFYCVFVCFVFCLIGCCFFCLFGFVVCLFLFFFFLGGGVRRSVGVGFLLGFFFFSGGGGRGG